MSPRRRTRIAYLGWDVGAWHCDSGRSRDALVLLELEDGGLRRLGTPYWGNLRETIALGTPQAVLKELLRHVDPQAGPFDRLVIAIDTPLGWPEAYQALLHGKRAPAVPEEMAKNPLLFRYTERWLSVNAKRFQSKKGRKSPLSAVNDMIGSQSTKGLALLAALGLRVDDEGVWHGNVGETQVVAIEAYPAPCRGSSSLRRVRRVVSPRLNKPNADKKDALTCALVGAMYDSDVRELAKPPVALPPDEGWIWVPGDRIEHKDNNV